MHLLGSLLIRGFDVCRCLQVELAVALRGNLVELGVNGLGILMIPRYESMTSLKCV